MGTGADILIQASILSQNSRLLFIYPHGLVENRLRLRKCYSSRSINNYLLAFRKVT